MLTNNEYVNRAIRTMKKRLGYEPVAYKIESGLWGYTWVSLMVIYDGSDIDKGHYAKAGIRAGMSSMHTPALEGEMDWSDFLEVGLHSIYSKIPEGYTLIA